MVAAPEGGDDPRVGTTVASRYFLNRILGRGGMGDVYAATRLGDERRVALKLLRAGPGEEQLRRFEREAALAARLKNEACVEVVESGRDPAAGHFLVMELVRGRDLAAVLRDEGRLPAARAAWIADGVLSALAAAHAAGVIHRDLKPANVMLDETDGGERVKVLDFGIATSLAPAPGEPALTRDGVAQGTPAYMAPEQIRGEAVDARADLYAVGALLFEMLAGAPAFEAPSPMAVAARQLTEDAPSLAARREDVPPALAALVARALARDPAVRPASAEEMRAALRAAVSPAADAPAALRRVAATEAFPAMTAPPARSARRRALVVGAAAAVALAAIGIVRTRTPTATATATSTSTSTPTATPTPTPTPTAIPTPTRTASASPPSTRTASASPTPTRTASATATAPAAPAPNPIRLVRGELNALPTPAVDSGDGILVLLAAPWAMVSVDGVPLGETPREVRLAAGTYDVRAVHPELGEREWRVQVRAGDRARWSISFER